MARAAASHAGRRGVAGDTHPARRRGWWVPRWRWRCRTCVATGPKGMTPLQLQARLDDVRRALRTLSLGAISVWVLAAVALTLVVGTVARSTIGTPSLPVLWSIASLLGVPWRSGAGTWCSPRAWRDWMRHSGWSRRRRTCDMRWSRWRSRNRSGMPTPCRNDWPRFASTTAWATGGGAGAAARVDDGGFTTGRCTAGAHRRRISLATASYAGRGDSGGGDDTCRFRCVSAGSGERRTAAAATRVQRSAGTCADVRPDDSCAGRQRDPCRRVGDSDDATLLVQESSDSGAGTPRAVTPAPRAGGWRGAIRVGMRRWPCGSAMRPVSAGCW